MAAAGGHSRALSALLELGADPARRTSEGATPLHLATEQGHLPAVLALARCRGVSLDERDGDGWTALMLAANEGHTQVRGGRPAGAAAAAACFSRMTAASYHLPPAAAIAAWGAWRRSPGSAEHACNASVWQVVAALLAAGASVGVQDAAGESPLHLASANGHLEVVDVLLAGERGQGWGWGSSGQI